MDYTNGGIFMDLFDKCRKYRAAKDIIDAGFYPYFHTLNCGQDTEVVMEGIPEIMLGSNNYMGLTSNKEVIQAGVDALRKYGSGCSGSRFLNGTLDLHVELENKLAKFIGKDDCITFGTGFQANLGIISAIAGRGDYIVGDKENHASIYDGCRLSYARLLRYEHSDMKDLEAQLSSVPKEAGILIVTDGVFSMGGDICKLPEIVKLAQKYGARVMIDDAHALGVIGVGGRGTASHFGLTEKVDLIMGTFSKSLASLGGYVVASAETIHYIKHNSRPFIFSASMPPSNIACASKALDIIINNPSRVQNLMDITAYAREGYKKRGIDIRDSEAPIIPINTYNDEDTFVLCKKLFENGVYVNPVISPAVPQGQSIIRTSYTATHTKEQIDRALDIIKATFDEFYASKK